MPQTGADFVREWAAVNGYKIVSLEPGTDTQSHVPPGNKSVQQFLFTARDAAGALKSGRAHCVRTGILSVEVDVRWDR